MSRSVVTATDAVTPSIHLTTRLEVAPNPLLPTRAGTEEGVKAVGPLLGQRNNLRCPQALGLRRPWSTMIRLTMTSVLIVTTMLTTEITNMMIVQIIMMMAKFATVDPMSRGIGNRQTMPGLSNRTIRVSLSWLVIWQKLSVCFKPMWRTLWRLPCRPTARCGRNF
jgi:hypothetical protein